MFMVRETASSTTGSPSGESQRLLDLTSACLEKLVMDEILPYLNSILLMQGELTMKQPIFHSDLATGIMNSLHDPEAVGQTYEAMGPQRLTQVPQCQKRFSYTNAILSA